ncbi:D-2-hydroxyacid dehydrogenase family protein [Pseudomonas sp.]|uniref:D-2-hydroxyacid dehydrogenase family protein n=1 Tax=Pseudomonas sp. TaxID=306 RepID=UPI003A96B427
MHIVIPDDYPHAVCDLDCFGLLTDHRVSVFHDWQQSSEVLLERFSDADAIVLTRERTRLDAKLLMQLPKLKLISQTGKVGAHVDVDACNSLGIAVVEGSGSPIAPAELTWALILNARRQLVAAINSFNAGTWQNNIGERLCGQTLGIWGYGRIGKRLAKYAQAFEMPVLVWGSEASRQAAELDGHSAADSSAAFFAQSDIISLHLRLSEQTKHLVNAVDLASMKPSALLVNTSRAELIAPGALLAAIDKGRPGYAALDVFETEPLISLDNPLLNHPKITCSPHIGYVEKHSYEQYFGEAFTNILNFFDGKPCQQINLSTISNARYSADAG